MRKVYTTLDDLLDTRLGFIGLYKPDVVDEWVKEGNKTYNLRASDDLFHRVMELNKKDYQTLWKTREYDTLMNSVLTHIPEAINERISQYKLECIEAVGTVKTKLCVNTYPYKLEKQELDDIKTALMEHLYSIDEIVFIHVSDKDLTPKYIKQNFHYAFWYYFNDWLDEHGKTVREMGTFSNVEVYLPRIFREDFDESAFEHSEEMKFIKEMGIFEVVSTSLSTKLNLNYLPASDFGPVFFKRQDPVETGLDQCDDPYEVYTLENSQYDPLSPFPLSGESSSESPSQDQE